MDHTHGIIDRILITTPLAFRLTLTEIEGAKERLETEKTSQSALKTSVILPCSYDSTSVTKFNNF